MENDACILSQEERLYKGLQEIYSLNYYNFVAISVKIRYNIGDHTVG